jgi:hypothetical protein
MRTRSIKFIATGMLSIACFLANAQQKNTTPQTHAFSAKEAVDYALKNAVQVKNALLETSGAD